MGHGNAKDLPQHSEISWLLLSEEEGEKEELSTGEISEWASHPHRRRYHCRFLTLNLDLTDAKLLIIAALYIKFQFFFFRSVFTSGATESPLTATVPITRYSLLDKSHSTKKKKKPSATSVVTNQV